MSALLSAPRVVLLAVHLATKSDIDGLTALAAQHTRVLHKELLLRILLSVLPETLRPSEYVSLVERIQSGDWDNDAIPHDVNTSSLTDIDDNEATKKVRRLRLLPLIWDGAPQDALDDPLTLFLIRRAHRVDQEAGLLTQLPDLVVPFLGHAPAIRTWVISALLPLLRRNHQYYPNEPAAQSLSDFETLEDHIAVSVLLDHTGARETDLGFVGRDLRGLIGPWLYNSARWTHKQNRDAAAEMQDRLCPGWEYVLGWLTAQALKSWRVAVSAVEQWDGPSDVDLGDYGSMWFEDEELEYLEGRYARAVLACAYLIPEASVDALSGVNTIITKIMNLLDQDPCPTLQVASSLLAPFSEPAAERLLCAKNATYMRNDLLEDSNPLTTPNQGSAQLLHALTLSAYILTKSGVPCTVRRAGELAFLQDEREQKAEATRMIRSFSSNGPKNDDKYWLRARNELLWLRDWGAEEDSGAPAAQGQGVFGQLKKEFLEVECLKAFLANSRYSLARSIYENSPDDVLDPNLVRETVVHAAMTAYDNATNPHRGRGGLLKCHDIIHAFPKTVAESSPDARHIEALLRATHALGEYRLVLKQGEPFTPVVLRVHPDPVSIVEKLLEQNPKSYTKIQDFLEIGANMVTAGLTLKDKSGHSSIAATATAEQFSQQRSIAERRITAMCVDAALAEDDFETAYSYVVNRISSMGGSTVVSSSNNDSNSNNTDEYSWKAALQAGRYRRTARTLRPTHIGTASGNLDIRHLEQRIECLSTAVRIAPASTLQEILNVFRKCEEELNAAVAAEQATASAWDAHADVGHVHSHPGQEASVMPGAFSSTVPAGVTRSGRPSRHTDEAPMSLFDLSRASIARAQRTLPALAGLQRGISGTTDSSNSHNRSSSSLGQHHGETGSDESRVRKRDQLREAAVGTLASGVGWLIGAQVGDRADKE